MQAPLTLSKARKQQPFHSLHPPPVYHPSSWIFFVVVQVMSLISWSSEDELVGMVNDCAFGLGSNVFSASQSRARWVAVQRVWLTAWGMWYGGWQYRGFGSLLKRTSGMGKGRKLQPSF